MSNDREFCLPCTCERCRRNYTDRFCSICCFESGNAFIDDLMTNSFDDLPNSSDHSPQSQYQTNSCELCGYNAHYGYDCPPQVPFVYNQDPCFNQNFDNNFLQTLPSLPQYLCCTRCGGPHETFQCDQLIFDEPYYENCGGPHMSFQCQPMNQNFYNLNSSGFNQFQPLQYPEESIKEFFVKHAQEMITTVQPVVKIVIQQHEQAVQKEQEEQAAFTPYWKIPIIDDDDDEYTIQYREYLENSSNAITPDLPTEEPDNSLSMGDEHLSTIPETESDEVIKSSVEDLVPIPSESEGISNDTCDVPFCNSPPLDVLNNHFEIFSDFNDDCTSSNDDSFEDIDYVEASPPDSELVSLEEVKDFDPEDGETDTDILLKIKDDILREKLLNINLLIAKIEALNDNPTPDCVLKSPSSFPIPVEDSDSFFEKSDTSLSYSDNSLPEFETFSDHTEETSSGSTTTHSDNSLPEYDSFLFEIEPDQGELSSIIMEDILGEPRVHVPNVLPTHLTLMLDSDFILSDDSLGSDLEVSFPSGTRNKIFDPGILFEVQSKRFLSRDTFSISFIRNPLCPVIETLLPFSSENEDKVFNPGILSSNLLSHRGKITFDFSESPMMISGGDIPFLDVLFLHFYPP
ncbi:hypothetical protein Tco_0467482 [Tanacetum coccineum]